MKHKPSLFPRALVSVFCTACLAPAFLTGCSADDGQENLASAKDAGIAGDDASGGSGNQSGGTTGSTQSPPANPAVSPPVGESPIKFIAGEMLGRPSDREITVHALLSEKVEAFYEAGTSTGAYSIQSPTATYEARQPVESVLGGLTADTEYFYRIRYRAAGSSEDFAAGEEHRFHTKRARGKAFSFVVQADPHLDDQSDQDVYRRTLESELRGESDFLVDLGDASMVDKCILSGAQLCMLKAATSFADVDARNLLHRTFFAEVSHSLPVFLVLGNHEGESGWRMKGAVDSLPYWDLEARKFYYPNPFPNDFYTGSKTPDPNAGLRENYYAFEWGDALFVMLDPFGYTMKSQAGWDWTLGREQYDWLKQTLEQSDAPFKFVFAHHLVGGTVPSQRGGIEQAHLYEWGGSSPDGTFDFDTQRPGWGKPIHDLLVDNHVSIFFHGHDHLYAYQQLDGVVYQEVPQPSHPTTSKVPTQAMEYGYANGVIRASSGHLRVDVSSSGLKVQYLRSYQASDENADRVNGSVEHSYEVPRGTP